LKSQTRSLPIKPSVFCLDSWIGRVIFLAIFSLVHFGLFGLTFLGSFSAVMAAASQERSLSSGGAALLRLSEITQWPLITWLGRSEFLREVLPSFSLPVIALLNSLLWAWAVLGIMLWVRQLQLKRPIGKSM
jgi:hypothetical protein